MRELHLFSGAGGGILGGMLLGHTTVCAVEIEPYCQDVLKARQRDEILPEFPVFGDIREFDGKPWRGKVDIVAGGFPCQDISSANSKAKGIGGARSGLWGEMARIISEVRPAFAFVENSPMLISRGLTRVLSDLAKMGYDSRWGIVGAHHVGLAHHRDRIWILAHTNRNGLERGKKQCDKKRWNKHTFRISTLDSSCSRLPVSDPGAFRNRYGVARNVDRLKAIGNGQVPAVAATAFRILSEGLI